MSLRRVVECRVSGIAWIEQSRFTVRVRCAEDRTQKFQRACVLKMSTLFS